MLRLAPSHPPLWRTPSSIQFGVDGAARVDNVVHWQEQVIGALEDGIPEGMLVPLATGFGASARDAARFAEAIRPALTDDDEAVPTVGVELPADLPYGEAAVFCDGLRNAGVHVGEVRSWRADPEGVPVVAVAHRLLDPRRAAHLAAADAVHIPVELSGDRVSVGPLVVPGRTACLSCLHAHRRDADPQWPLLAAQLLGRPAVPTAPALLLEAALLTARLLRTRPAEGSTSVSVSAASGRRNWRAHRPHERCLCRSPAGIAIADGHDDRSCEPTTARAYARPA